MSTELLLVAFLIFVGVGESIEQTKKRGQQIEQREIEQHNKEQQKIEQQKIEQLKIEQQKIEQLKIEQQRKALAESMRSEADLRNELWIMEKWLVDTQEPLNDFNHKTLKAFANDPFSLETQALINKQADWMDLSDFTKVKITKLKKLLEKYEKTNHQPADDIVTINSVGKG